MIRIMFGDEEADAKEVKSIVSDIFQLPDITDVYEIKVTFAGDKRFWKVLEIIPCYTLDALYADICAAFNLSLKPYNDYCFYMSGQEDVFSRYTPSDSQKPSKKTTDANLSDLDLPIGHKFLLLIDTEPNIKFEIELKKINRFNDRKLYPLVLRQGQAFQNK
jgi:hypothetical protein